MVVDAARFWWVSIILVGNFNRWNSNLIYDFVSKNRSKVESSGKFTFFKDLHDPTPPASARGASKKAANQKTWEKAANQGAKHSSSKRKEAIPKPKEPDFPPYPTRGYPMRSPRNSDSQSQRSYMDFDPDLLHGDGLLSNSSEDDDFNWAREAKEMCAQADAWKKQRGRLAEVDAELDEYCAGFKHRIHAMKERVVAAAERDKVTPKRQSFLIPDLTPRNRTPRNSMKSPRWKSGAPFSVPKRTPMYQKTMPQTSSNANKSSKESGKSAYQPEGPKNSRAREGGFQFGIGKERRTSGLSTGSSAGRVLSPASRAQAEVVQKLDRMKNDSSSWGKERKNLLVKWHPDRHRNNAIFATRMFQFVQNLNPPSA